MELYEYTIIRLILTEWLLARKVLISPFTCDRTGSGDAVVAGILRKLAAHPKMYTNQDYLERQLRFAVAAGIIAQWTIGAVRGFPTESATQNLKEQVYVPSMW